MVLRGHSLKANIVSRKVVLCRSYKAYFIKHLSWKEPVFVMAKKTMFICAYVIMPLAQKTGKWFQKSRMATTVFLFKKKQPDRLTDWGFLSLCYALVSYSGFPFHLYFTCYLQFKIENVLFAVVRRFFGRLWKHKPHDSTSILGECKMSGV